jgi:pimeloyl-ACP methyl ester carboxylesterase
MLPPLEEHSISTGEVTLHVMQAGPVDGPIALLLHGFPEFWFGWRHQVGPLVEAGYRVWAPDQRGYNISDKPAETRAYQIDRLAGDVAALIQATGRERVHLIGHDWGAAVAWRVAMLHPERLEKLVILNVPHPVVMLQHLRTNPRQMLRSWYIYAFQLPGLAEWLLSRNQWQGLADALTSTSRSGTFTPEDLQRYRSAWSQPGALTAMLNWYRALLRCRVTPVASPRIQTPTLMLWGARDHALCREMAQPSIDLCDRGELVFLESASHWVQHEEPAEVNRRILEFLARPT